MSKEKDRSFEEKISRQFFGSPTSLADYKARKEAEKQLGDCSLCQFPIDADERYIWSETWNTKVCWYCVEEVVEASKAEPQ